MTEMDTGALSPAGRFQRMEDALERIEKKLDGKAEHIDVLGLEVRVGNLERGEIERIAEHVAAKGVSETRYRLVLWAVSLVTIAGVIFNAAFAVFNKLNP